MLFVSLILYLSVALGSIIPYDARPNARKVEGTLPSSSLSSSANPHLAGRGEQYRLSSESVATNSTLDVFQVYKPLEIPDEATGVHTILLLNHSFQNSYGNPYVGNYTPPSTRFTNVHINLTVTSRGRQFDRLALLYLDDVEVFRTSTAEPTPQGIIWSYSKDMTQYLTLWRAKQKVIFDLGNLVNEIYTGFFNVTLTATFFSLPTQVETADFILPISAKRSAEDMPSAFIIPSDNATTMISLPPSTSRAIVSIAACGQADEEFWYSNVPSSVTATWRNTTGDLLGFGSFREVQLYIDGMLAGLVWPFPIVFTGGIAPGLWKPLVGIDAFDLREFEIDIAPFIMLLTDGKPHSFSIRVVGLSTNNAASSANLSNTVGNNWVVTGKVFIFLDPFGAEPQWDHVPPVVRDTPASIKITTTLTQSRNESTHAAQNESLAVDVEVARDLRVFSLSGFWGQNAGYLSHNGLTNAGLDQVTRQGTLGSVRAVANPRSGPPVRWSAFFTQPITVVTNLTLFTDARGASAGIGIKAQIRRDLDFVMDGAARPDISVYSLVQGDREMRAYQTGEAAYSSQPNKSYSFGTTVEEFEEGSRFEGFWRRNVQAVNGSVVRDGEAVGWGGNSGVGRVVGEEAVEVFVDGNATARIGRGPGPGKL